MLANQYFRVLSTPQAFENWNRGGRTSFHASPPGDWDEKWKRTKSTNIRDYPLDAFGGPYAPAARLAYLDAVQRYSNVDLWPEKVRLATSELAGLCTFTTVAATLDYVKGSPSWNANTDRYLVLCGREIGGCVENESVLIDEVSVFDGPMARDCFTSSYGS